MGVRPQGARWARIGRIVIVVIALSSMAQAKDKRTMVVMTQNLYLGSSLGPATGATTPEEFIIGVATIYATVLFTDYPKRAEAIADQIAAENPGLIGLQEVSLWTTIGPAPPGFDFLAILQQALMDRGLSYSVAAVSDNANIGPVPLAYPRCAVPSHLGACLVSLQDRDVILVNDGNLDFSVFNPQSGNYVAQNVLSTPVGPLSFNRGWASLDGKLEVTPFQMAPPLWPSDHAGVVATVRIH